jgi:hypothetical protein
MDRAFFIFAGYVLLLGPGSAALLFWLNPLPLKSAKAAAPEFEGNCIHCGSAVNKLGQCPNIELSGIECFDRNRFNCGRAELRDLWKAGVA